MTLVHFEKLKVEAINCACGQSPPRARVSTLEERTKAIAQCARTRYPSAVSARSAVCLPCLCPLELDLFNDSDFKDSSQLANFGKERLTEILT